MNPFLLIASITISLSATAAPSMATDAKPAPETECKSLAIKKNIPRNQLDDFVAKCISTYSKASPNPPTPAKTTDTPAIDCTIATC